MNEPMQSGHLLPTPPTPPKLDLKEVERLFTLSNLNKDFYTKDQLEFRETHKSIFLTREQTYVLGKPYDLHERLLKENPEKFD